MAGITYKAIVVGTDGSERAGVAVRHALAIAKGSGATLHVVHVLHASVATGFSDTVAGQVEVDTHQAHADRAGEAVMEEAEKQGVPAELHHPGGDAADALIQVAEDTNSDLIVVGNRGMTGMGRVLGSVPNKVAHRASCSVLIVNTGASS
jgi:nucleotide-binding universal stress UspA family protein